MQGRVRILIGVVLVAALSAQGGPSAAGEGHGGKIVFARLVSGVVGAGNSELFVMNADGTGVT